LMIQNATEVRLIIFIEILWKNSSDLESKFLQYLAQNSQDKLPFMIFIAQGMALLISKIGWWVLMFRLF
jgi:hypothetical protein